MRYYYLHPRGSRRSGFRAPRFSMVGTFIMRTVFVIMTAQLFALLSVSLYQAFYPRPMSATPRQEVTTHHRESSRERFYSPASASPQLLRTGGFGATRAEEELPDHRLIIRRVQP